MKIWECLVQKSTLKKNKFVFVYVMQKSDLLYDKALEIAKKYDLTILSISMVENDRKLGKDMRGASVEDFLWMIKNAEYVITNSFHGIMMSLRFHKEFYWAFQQGAHMSNPRFQMLIDDYGIDKCCCNNVDQSKLAYKIIDEKMESQRHQSIINLRNYNRLLES